MKRKSPPLDIDKEVQELMRKLETIKDESGFWKETDDKVQKKTKK
jgi:hypothetical protein